MKVYTVGLPDAQTRAVWSEVLLEDFPEVRERLKFKFIEMMGMQLNTHT